MRRPAATEFTIRTDNRHVKYEAKCTDRWHWHHAVNGRIVYNNSQTTRRGARRAILRDMKNQGLVEVR